MVVIWVDSSHAKAEDRPGAPTGGPAGVASRGNPGNVGNGGQQRSPFFGLLPLVILGSLAVLGSGCATTPPEIISMQQQLDVMQQQLATIQQQSSDRGQVERLEATVAQAQEQLLKGRADAEADLRVLLGRIEALAASVQESTIAVKDVSEETAALRRAIVELQAIVDRPVQPAPSPTLSGSEAYEAALQAFQNADYRTALRGFTAFLEGNPDSATADNALYWTGECHFSLREFRGAIRQFTAVRQRYPASEKVPSALLRTGKAYLELGDGEQATSAFRSVMADYPRSDEAILAQRELREIPS